VPADPPAAKAPHRHAARVLDAESPAEIARELERTLSEPEGVGLMVPKGRVYAVRLDDVPLKAAPLLKQELLAVGGESSHARGVADHSVATTPAVLLATWGQYRRLLPKLARQPFRLREIGEEVEHALRAYLRHGPRTVPGAHRPIVVGDRPRVMGVLNVTPDSFSDGGLFATPAAAIARAEAMVAEGADVIDVGGESTRPGATPVTPDQEWSRIGPVITALAGRLPVPVSVDTRHAEVATRAVDAGADLVNDVEGLRSAEMRRSVQRSGAAVVAMHMRGDPTTMQSDLAYGDLRDEVYRWLAARTDEAVAEGIAPEKILVDPGLGFGKAPEQSLELLLHVGELRSLGYPVVVGASRKSFLGWALGSEASAQRLEPGLAAAVLATEHGADLVRVHDVGPTVRALSLLRAARSLQPSPTDTAAAAIPRPEGEAE
jgi:dihydropteroate synthase